MDDIVVLFLLHNHHGFFQGGQGEGGDAPSRSRVHGLKKAALYIQLRMVL